MMVRCFQTDQHKHFVEDAPIDEFAPTGACKPLAFAQVKAHEVAFLGARRLAAGIACRYGLRRARTLLRLRSCLRIATIFLSIVIIRG